MGLLDDSVPFLRPFTSPERPGERHIRRRFSSVPMALLGVVGGVTWLWGIGSLVALVAGAVVLADTRRHDVAGWVRACAVIALATGAVGLAVALKLGYDTFSSHSA